MKSPDRILSTPSLAHLEQSVLGGILLRNDQLAELETLEVADFADLKHQAVFEAMRNLEATGRAIDIVTLEAEIEKRGKLDAIGGVAFLGELAMAVPTAANTRAYARLVQERATIRRIALAAEDLLARARGWEDDSDELLSEAMSVLAKLDRTRPDSAVLIGELAKRRLVQLDAISAARQRGEQLLTGVPTGIKGLDRKIGGYQLGIVNLLAGRPAMGKTAMAMSSVAAATTLGYAAHVFSQEDAWQSYTDRALSRESGISAEKLRQGELDRDNVQALFGAVTKLRLRQNWLVDDRAGLSAQEIIRSVRRHRAKLNTKLVVVDYVQLVRRAREFRADENAALDDIMTAFSNAAKADGLAYLVLCQLNRDVEKRLDKRPGLADLRGSGALEERSKLVVSPFRSSYYTDTPKRGVDWDCECPDAMPNCPHRPNAEAFERLVQVLVLKNNNGQTGRVFASWRGETTEIW